MSSQYREWLDQQLSWNSSAGVSPTPEWLLPSRKLRKEAHLIARNVEIPPLASPSPSVEEADLGFCAFAFWIGYICRSGTDELDAYQKRAEGGRIAVELLLRKIDVVRNEPSVRKVQHLLSSCSAIEIACMRLVNTYCAFLVQNLWQQVDLAC